MMSSFVLVFGYFATSFSVTASSRASGGHMMSAASGEQGPASSSSTTQHLAHPYSRTASCVPGFYYAKVDPEQIDFGQIAPLKTWFGVAVDVPPVRTTTTTTGDDDDAHHGHAGTRRSSTTFFNQFTTEFEVGISLRGEDESDEAFSETRMSSSSGIGSGGFSEASLARDFSPHLDHVGISVGKPHGCIGLGYVAVNISHRTWLKEERNRPRSELVKTQIKCVNGAAVVRIPKRLGAGNLPWRGVSFVELRLELVLDRLEFEVLPAHWHFPGLVDPPHMGRVSDEHHRIEEKIRALECPRAREIRYELSRQGGRERGALERDWKKLMGGAESSDGSFYSEGGDGSPSWLAEDEHFAQQSWATPEFGLSRDGFADLGRSRTSLLSTGGSSYEADVSAGETTLENTINSSTEWIFQDNKSGVVAQWELRMLSSFDRGSSHWGGRGCTPQDGLTSLKTGVEFGEFAGRQDLVDHVVPRGLRPQVVVEDLAELLSPTSQAVLNSRRLFTSQQLSLLRDENLDPNFGLSHNSHEEEDPAQILLEQLCSLSAVSDDGPGTSYEDHNPGAHKSGSSGYKPTRSAAHKKQRRDLLLRRRVSAPPGCATALSIPPFETHHPVGVSLASLQRCPQTTPTGPQTTPQSQEAQTTYRYSRDEVLDFPGPSSEEDEAIIVRLPKNAPQKFSSDENRWLEETAHEALPKVWEALRKNVNRFWKNDCADFLPGGLGRSSRHDFVPGGRRWSPLRPEQLEATQEILFEALRQRGRNRLFLEHLLNGDLIVEAPGTGGGGAYRFPEDFRHWRETVGGGEDAVAGAGGKGVEQDHLPAHKFAGRFRRVNAIAGALARRYTYYRTASFAGPRIIQKTGGLAREFRQALERAGEKHDPDTLAVLPLIEQWDGTRRLKNIG